MTQFCRFCGSEISPHRFADKFSKKLWPRQIAILRFIESRTDGVSEEDLFNKFGLTKSLIGVYLSRIRAALHTTPIGLSYKTGGVYKIIGDKSSD